MPYTDICDSKTTRGLTSKSARKETIEEDLEIYFEEAKFQTDFYDYESIFLDLKACRPRQNIRPLVIPHYFMTGEYAHTKSTGPYEYLASIFIPFQVTDRTCYFYLKRMEGESNEGETTWRVYDCFVIEEEELPFFIMEKTIYPIVESKGLLEPTYSDILTKLQAESFCKQKINFLNKEMVELLSKKDSIKIDEVLKLFKR